MELLKLKAFPLTLKDKVKIWLNSQGQELSGIGQNCRQIF